MTELSWSRCAEAFAWDGAWRDIYVRGTSMVDWDALFRALPGWGYRIAFEVGEQTRDLPDSAKPAFEAAVEAVVTLRVHVGTVEVIGHFFAADEMEFDVDPREVRGEAEFQELLAFMRRLATLVGKPVTLTPENDHERPLITVDPRRAVPEYHGGIP